MSYPEHEKLAAVSADSHRLGAFIDWLDGKGYRICEYAKVGFDSDRLTPVHKTINQWLADFYGIDLQRINDEKEQMLAEIDRRSS